MRTWFSGNLRLPREMNRAGAENMWLRQVPWVLVEECIGSHTMERIRAHLWISVQSAL
jgi:hypothetical protein